MKMLFRNKTDYIVQLALSHRYYLTSNFCTMSILAEDDLTMSEKFDVLGRVAVAQDEMRQDVSVLTSVLTSVDHLVNERRTELIAQADILDELALNTSGSAIAPDILSFKTTCAAKIDSRNDMIAALQQRAAELQHSLSVHRSKASALEEENNALSGRIASILASLDGHTHPHAMHTPHGALASTMSTLSTSHHVNIHSSASTSAAAMSAAAAEALATLADTVSAFECLQRDADECALQFANESAAHAADIRALHGATCAVAPLVNAAVAPPPPDGAVDAAAACGALAALREAVVAVLGERAYAARVEEEELAGGVRERDAMVAERRDVSDRLKQEMLQLIEHSVNDLAQLKVRDGCLEAVVGVGVILFYCCSRVTLLMCSSKAVVSTRPTAEHRPGGRWPPLPRPTRCHRRRVRAAAPPHSHGADAHVPTATRPGALLVAPIGPAHGRATWAHGGASGGGPVGLPSFGPGGQSRKITL